MLVNRHEPNVEPLKLKRLNKLYTTYLSNDFRDNVSGFRRDHKEAGRSGSGSRAEEGDAVAIAAEELDVFVDPFQGHRLV